MKVCGIVGDVWEGWRCVEGVEKCGGRFGGVWEGWRCVGRSEVCGRGGDVLEGVRCVGGVEMYFNFRNSCN